MSIKYISRKSQTFYLHRSNTTAGGSKYFFSLKSDGILADTIPDGYEIYENPNAQVFLRKVQPKIIADLESAVVEKGMRQYSDVKYYIIDTRKNAIIVYLADQDIDAIKEILPAPFISKFESWEKALNNILSYSPMLRFVLIDKAKRKFIAERYCFLGSIDDWINIGGPDRLENLTKKFLKHLGKESVFELF
jgi:hypothetical protein